MYSGEGWITSVLLLENVPLWQNASSMWLLRHQLRDLGYVVHERVVHSGDWNCLEQRSRLAVTAVTVGMEFDYKELIPPPAETVKVSSILEPVAKDDPSWSTMQYLKDKEVSDAEAGKGFKMHIVDGESTQVSCLGAHYVVNTHVAIFVSHCLSWINSIFMAFMRCKKNVAWDSEARLKSLG